MDTKNSIDTPARNGTTGATGAVGVVDPTVKPDAMKVVRGNPSEEELAAVLTVLLALRHGGSGSGDGGAENAQAPARASWARLRGFGAPAGSWRAAA